MWMDGEIGDEERRTGVLSLVLKLNPTGRLKRGLQQPSALFASLFCLMGEAVWGFALQARPQICSDSSQMDN